MSPTEINNFDLAYNQRSEVACLLVSVSLSVFLFLCVCVCVSLFLSLPLSLSVSLCLSVCLCVFPEQIRVRTLSNSHLFLCSLTPSLLSPYFSSLSLSLSLSLPQAAKENASRAREALIMMARDTTDTTWGVLTMAIALVIYLAVGFTASGVLLSCGV
jgi:hypothetical protein